jgi:hypothetical protein
MRNFGKQNIGKKTWGVLGKQQTYFYQPGLATNKEKTPLNANPMDAWDLKKSRYRRIDLMPKVQMENDGQQAGVVPQVSATPAVSPTPTPTTTTTSTPTPTPTITPSSTPFPLPETPSLWYDATNIGSIDYISSGGTDYVAAWRSIGTYQKVLTGTTTDTMPVWSGSSLFPSSQLVVRFNKSATAGLRDFLTQRFDSTVVPVSGSSVFMVVGNPGFNYSASTTVNGFGFNMLLYSGNTTTGGFIPTPSSFPVNYGTAFNSGTNNVLQLNITYSGYSIIGNGITAFSASNLNNKFLYTHVIPYPSGLPNFALNNSTTATTANITGTTASNINAISIGTVPTSGGTLSTNINPGVEIGEIMVFGRPLTAGEQTQVQNYLKDKWNYTSW